MYDSGLQLVGSSPVVWVGAPSDELKLDADSTLVNAGSSVGFHAYTLHKASFEVKAWEWAADSGQAATVPCANQDSVCVAAIRESGTMTVRALVHGVEQTASQHILLRKCPFFTSPTADSLLDDPNVQDGLRDLWTKSNPGDPLNAREMGGYIVLRNGVLGIEPFTSNTNPQACAATIIGSDITNVTTTGGQVLAWVHTHPHAAGDTVPPNGTCLGITQPGSTWGDGPSRADKNAARKINIPGYIVDPGHVHKMPPFFKGQKPTFNRNAHCP